MDAEKGRTTFQWVKATVEREFNGQYGYGLKFEEDADGNIWNLQGEWNETTNRPDPYTGDGFRQGEVVNVQLVHRTYTRKDGSQGEGRNINKIRKAEGEPTAATEAPEETGAAPATNRSTTDQRIAKAQALNLLIQIKGQGAVEEVLGITPEAANQIVKDELLRLAKGEEVDGSTLVALLDTQEQEPEEETPAEEPSSDEPKEDVEQLSWD